MVLFTMLVICVFKATDFTLKVPLFTLLLGQLDKKLGVADRMRQGGGGGGKGERISFLQVTS